MPTAAGGTALAKPLREAEEQKQMAANAQAIEQGKGTAAPALSTADARASETVGYKDTALVDRIGQVTTARCSTRHVLRSAASSELPTSAEAPPVCQACSLKQGS